MTFHAMKQTLKNNLINNRNQLRKIVLAAVIGLAGWTTQAQSSFQPKHIAVLRAGDGVVKLHLKQAPVFIDEFAPGNFNKGPIMSVAIPTKGADTIFFNGHAATEGMLSRSADGKLLAFAGYGGVNLLQQSGTPSLLDIGRAFCTVDAAGKTHTIIYEQYGGTEKMNPRGATTDGSDHFWSCGNASATGYFDASGGGKLVSFTAVPDSRQVKIIGGTLYTTLNGPDAIFINVEPGIYSFQDDGSPVPLPKERDTTLKMAVPIVKPYTKI